MSESVRDTILEVMEASLKAQLRAVRQLRKGTGASVTKRSKGKSQMDMVEDVLREAGIPLHLKEIVSKVNLRFAVNADFDSLGSALTKRVLKKERFCRPAKNTFALLEQDHVG